MSSRKSPRLAAVLSLVVPGLGQLYVEESMTANLVLLLLGWSPIGATTYVLLAYGFSSGWRQEFWPFAAAYVVLGILAGFHAHRLARRWNRGLYTLHRAEPSFMPDSIDMVRSHDTDRLR